MMDFIYELYQNDNFVLYLTIALVILIVLFVIVLIFGKRDQKLEETRKLQKIEMDTFKEVPMDENKEDSKLEVPTLKEEKKEIPSAPAETEPAKPAKSIFDDTQVIPIAKNEEAKPTDDSEEISVTTFEPEEEKEDVPEIPELPKKESAPAKPLLDVDEENKPINIQELNEIKFDDAGLENDLNELESIKKEFDSIKLPSTEETPKSEKKPEERKGYNSYKPGPKVFSSVFVSKDESALAETPAKEEMPTETVKAPEKASPVKEEKVNLFSIADDDDEEIELPALKK